MQEPPSPPRHEPGGNRLMVAVLLIVATGLGGIAASMLSRNQAAPSPSAVQARQMPPVKLPAIPTQPPPPPAQHKP